MTDLSFIPKVLTLADGTAFERLEAITDFRGCHDGFPAESRVLFWGKQCSPNDGNSEYVIKVKLQVPSESRNSTTPAAGPSDTATAEVKALQIFQQTNNTYAPHFVATRTLQDSPNPFLPGGYTTFTIMTALPGKSLLSLSYWSMPLETRQKIQHHFLEALRSVRSAGIEPGDKGLRNILWDEATQRCGLVDFELWSPFSGLAGDDDEELRNWGLASRPPSKNWWAEFGIETA